MWGVRRQSLKPDVFFFAFLNYSLVVMWSKVVSNNCKRPIFSKLWQKNFEKTPCECLPVKQPLFVTSKLCSMRCPIYPCWIKIFCFINHHGRQKSTKCICTKHVAGGGFWVFCFALHSIPTRRTIIPADNLVSIVYCW